MKVEAQTRLSQSGLWIAMATYTVWGLFPLYFKWLVDIPAPEVLAHRITWSFVFTCLLILILGLKPSIREALSKRENVPYFLCSSALIGANWLLYVYGVAIGEVLELSLAFFINPIFNVIFGVVFFKERLNKLSIFAVILVVLGLLVQLGDISHFPVLAVVLALVFSLYGLVRKKATLDPVPGLFIETALLLPFALLYLTVFGRESSLMLMQGSWSWALLLMFAGPLTSVPLIAFAMAVQRIPYYLLGFCQYLTPTCLLLLAIFLYGETFTSLNLITFSLVWSGIILSLGQSLWANLRRRAYE